MKLKICEMYKTVMGEGRHVGRSCLLVRLSGCNLDCPYCDTKYAKRNREIINTKTLTCLTIVHTQSGEILLLTGGEPLLQHEPVIDLITKLKIIPNLKIVVETNGSMNVSDIILQKSEVCMDIKTPSCFKKQKDFDKYLNTIFENLAILTKFDDVKIVINSEDDWEWLQSHIIEFLYFNDWSRYYISHTENFPFNLLWKKFVESSINKRNIFIQTQLHKVAFKNGQKEAEIERII